MKSKNKRSFGTQLFTSRVLDSTDNVNSYKHKFNIVFELKYKNVLN